MMNLDCLQEYSRSDALKVLARRRLACFLDYDGQGAWQSAPHLELLCDKIHNVIDGKCKRLMVFMPPRHGKSEVISKKFPAWYLGKYPDKEVILTSYSVDLACDFSRIARNTLREHAETFGVELAKDSSGVLRWGLEGHRGGLVAAGVGGPITGRGADCAIVDDPFKNWQDAESETIRKNVYEWYRSTLRTRLSPTGAIILVMTRWHEDDLAGRLLKDAAEGNGEKWDAISLAAESQGAGDALGRSQGVYLWPSRFDATFYADTRKALGSRLWSALYQQNPTPAEGLLFKREWWRFYRQAPSKFDEVIQSWDCAFKDLKTSDYVVGQVWGRIGADKYLLDQVRGQMNIKATMQVVESLSAKWPQAGAKLIEDKANGTAVIDLLKSKLSGVIPVNPEGGKVVRAQAVAPDIEAGNVYLPDPAIAPWVHDYIEEFAAFPNGKNDDQVDSTSQALVRMENNTSGLQAYYKKLAEDAELRKQQLHQPTQAETPCIRI